MDKTKWTNVDRDEVIAEVESEKATFEVNAEQAGVLKKWLTKAYFNWKQCWHK